MRSCYPVLVATNGMIAPQTSNVLVLEIAGEKSSSSEVMVSLMEGGTVNLVDCIFARS